MVNPEKAAELLETARRRNSLIPPLLKSGGYFIQRTPFHSLFINGILPKVFIESMDLEGEDNLKRALQLSKSHKLIINLNHTSDADHTAVRAILENKGFGEIADRNLYLGGLRMKERPHTDRLLGSENLVFTMTPFDKREVDEALANSAELGYSKEEVNEIKTYKENGDKLDIRSIRKAIEWLRKQGVVTFYPEATRSRHNKSLMQKGQPEVETLYRLGNFVLPMMIVGVSEAFPPENRFRLSRLRLTLIAGEPYSVAELISEDTREILKKDFDATPVDLAMARIGRLRWEQVDPRYCSLYQAIDEKFKPAVAA